MSTLISTAATSIPAQVPVKEPAWHAAFPSPRNTNPESITRQELLDLLTKKRSIRDFVLVDLRRVDYVGGTIHSAINLPAQSLYPTIPTLYEIFAAAGVRMVVWYCGSSKGRGTRAAGWFDDFIKDRGDGEMKSVILEGGVVGWAGAGVEYVELMDGYVKEAWK
ncbi:Rhodanese-like domain-containing protein [Leptodontidium sp. MPI-SDFR-AT-0119]|nr:Rhodanese-like domain-containing protein [Leptodontidium sp. MPI-SDFR-AT-0119]